LSSESQNNFHCGKRLQELPKPFGQLPPARVAARGNAIVPETSAALPELLAEVAEASSNRRTMNVALCLIID
jgi:hypothetical protein